MPAAIFLGVAFGARDRHTIGGLLIIIGGIGPILFKERPAPVEEGEKLQEVEARWRPLIKSDSGSEHTHSSIMRWTPKNTRNSRPAAWRLVHRKLIEWFDYASYGYLAAVIGTLYPL